MDVCIQCRRTADEIAATGHTPIMLARPRPMHRSEYVICLACARDVKISDSAKSMQAQPVLAGASTTYSPVRVNGDAGKLSERGRGNP